MLFFYLAMHEEPDSQSDIEPSFRLHFVGLHGEDLGLGERLQEPFRNTGTTQSPKSSKEANKQTQKTQKLFFNIYLDLKTKAD